MLLSLFWFNNLPLTLFFYNTPTTLLIVLQYVIQLIFLENTQNTLMDIKG